MTDISSLTQPYFYRDDDSVELKRVKNEIIEGGCKPVLWNSFEEMKKNWHDGFVGGATDERIVINGKITSGAEDIANLSKIVELECPLALLTNYDSAAQVHSHDPDNIRTILVL